MDMNSGLWTRAPHRKQRFSHQQLDYSKQEFRLLKIERPGLIKSRSASAPRCIIRHFSLHSAPPYKAVSYRWGDYTSSSSILVNGLPLEISDNLSDFFSQGQLMEQVSKSDDAWPSGQFYEEGLRDLWADGPVAQAEKQWAKEPWLWIDQLCIDQSSITEKNHQVAQMGVIFFQATGVLVWLGKGVDGTETAVNVAATSAKRSRRAEQINSGLGQGMSELQAFQKIVANPYWSRLWIIQEFVLARTVLILCGSKQVSGAQFRELARDMAQLDKSPALMRIWPFMTARRRLTTAYTLKRVAHTYGSESEGLQAPEFQVPGLQYTWQDVMKLAKKAECRDVRDRVYGMLSMVRQQVRIGVDYTASTGQIRELVMEREFVECFDRPYSQASLEEVGDEEFERFLVDLDIALELVDLGISAEETQLPVPFDNAIPKVSPLERKSDAPSLGRMIKGSRLSRNFAKIGWLGGK